jgi:hypothetical protein
VNLWSLIIIVLHTLCRVLIESISNLQRHHSRMVIWWRYALSLILGNVCCQYNLSSKLASEVLRVLKSVSEDHDSGASFSWAFSWINIEHFGSLDEVKENVIIRVLLVIESEFNFCVLNISTVRRCKTTDMS